MSTTTDADLRAFWAGYLATDPPDPPALGSVEVWSFGDGPEMADELCELVLDGRKTATASALWAYGDEPLPDPGERSVLTDGSGTPRCVVETTDVTVRRFDEVSESFARDEGEGDRSLAYWRAVHREFFERTLPSDSEFDESMPVVCEWVRVVYAPSRE